MSRNRHGRAERSKAIRFSLRAMFLVASLIGVYFAGRASVTPQLNQARLQAQQERQRAEQAMAIVRAKSLLTNIITDRDQQDQRYWREQFTRNGARATGGPFDIPASEIISHLEQPERMSEKKRQQQEQRRQEDMKNAFEFLDGET